MQYRVNASSGNIVAGGNGPGASNTQLYTPVDVHFDANASSLYILNQATHNIVHWNIGSTTWSILVGSPSGGYGATMRLLYSPQSMLIDANGDIYVADTSNHRIQLFPAGQINATTIVGIAGVPGSTSEALNAPYSIAFDSNRNLYVVDTNNQRVQMFTRY